MFFAKQRIADLILSPATNSALSSAVRLRIPETENDTLIMPPQDLLSFCELCNNIPDMLFDVHPVRSRPRLKASGFGHLGAAYF